MSKGAGELENPAIGITENLEEVQSPSKVHIINKQTRQVGAAQAKGHHNSRNRENNSYDSLKRFENEMMSNKQFSFMEERPSQNSARPGFTIKRASKQ